jgi:uncharacterized membrane protein (UPF0127 family)
MRRSAVARRVVWGMLLGAALGACHQEASAAGDKKPAPAAVPPAAVPKRDRLRPDFRWARVVVQTPSGDVPLKVEVAENDPQRMHGLMFKESMPETEGMVFVFQEAREQWFWMKNTLIPLDMIFIGEDRRVVGIYENAAPLSLARMGVQKPSLYVLEVNAGWSRRNNIGPGTQLRFEGVE